MIGIEWKKSRLHKRLWSDIESWNLVFRGGLIWDKEKVERSLTEEELGGITGVQGVKLRSLGCEAIWDVESFGIEQKGATNPVKCEQMSHDSGKESSFWLHLE